MLLDGGLFRERPRQHEFGFEHGVEGVEIDRQSPEALAILGRSARFDRKGRPGAPAAAGAGVEKALMLDDLEQPLRQIEHLTPLNACRHRRTRGAAAMQASRGRMRHDPVGLGDLAKGFALVPLLPAARAPDGSRRLTGFFFRPSLDGGFELVQLSSPSRRRSSAFSARNVSSSR